MSEVRFEPEPSGWKLCFEPLVHTKLKDCFGSPDPTRREQHLLVVSSAFKSFHGAMVGLVTIEPAALTSNRIRSKLFKILELILIAKWIDN